MTFSCFEIIFHLTVFSSNTFLDDVLNFNFDVTNSFIVIRVEKLRE